MCHIEKELIQSRDTDELRETIVFCLQVSYVGRESIPYCRTVSNRPSFSHIDLLAKSFAWAGAVNRKDNCTNRENISL